MPLASTKSKAKIGLGGGGIAYLREVLESGVDLGTPDTNHSVGYLEGTDLDDNTAQVEVWDEAGHYVTTLDDKRTVKYKAILQQSSGDEIGIIDEVRGKFYRLYHQTGIRNGKTQEWLYGICRITPHLALAWKSGALTNIPLEIAVLYNAAAITIGNATLPAEKVTVGDVVIPIGKYYKLTET